MNASAQHKLKSVGRIKNKHIKPRWTFISAPTVALRAFRMSGNMKFWQVFFEGKSFGK